MKKHTALAILLLVVATHAFAEATNVVFDDSADASQSTYDWTGPYVGGFMGVSKGGNVPNPEFAFFISEPSDPWDKEAPNARNYSVVSPDKNYYNPLSVGVGFGYNLHFKNTPIWLPNVIGIDGSIGTIDLSISKAITNFHGSTPDAEGVMGEGRNGYTNEVSGLYRFIGGKLGYAVSRSLYYVKSGYFFTQSESTLELQNILSFERKKSEERNFAFGFGLERAFEKINGRQTSLFLEYMNVDLRNNSILEYNDPLSCTPPLCYPLTNRYNPAGIQFDYQRLQTIKVGMNVRF